MGKNGNDVDWVHHAKPTIPNLPWLIIPNQQSIRCSEISLWVYHITNYIFNGVVSWNHGEISDCIRFSKLNLHWTAWRGWIWMLQKPPHETNHGRPFPSGTPSETLPRGIGGVHSGVIFRSQCATHVLHQWSTETISRRFHSVWELSSSHNGLPFLKRCTAKLNHLVAVKSVCELQILAYRGSCVILCIVGGNSGSIPSPIPFSSRMSGGSNHILNPCWHGLEIASRCHQLGWNIQNSIRQQDRWFHDFPLECPGNQIWLQNPRRSLC